MTRWGVLTCSRVCVVQASTRRTRESAEGHPGPASGSDKGGQLAGLSQQTVDSLLKGAEAREGAKTSLIGDANLFVLLLPYLQNN